MTYLAAALALGAAGTTARWWLRRYDALGRARRFPAFTVATLAVLAVASLVPSYLRHSEESRLSTVAATLVGARAQVRCQTAGAELVDAGAELGSVKWAADGRPERRTLIKRPPCTALRHYLHSDKRHPTRDEVVAVHVLTHEAMHMRGEKVEATAECEAVQRDAATARLLGADLGAARQLAVTYWRAVYPHMPDDYRTGDCGPGGRLDEHLDDAPWSDGT